MSPTDPALFYTGVVAQLYGALRGTGPFDPTPYARFIERSGQPALELGCGEGDPLLDLLAMGLDVEGLDSSPDMLARCRVAAATRGLDPVLHEQPIESMQIDRLFSSIFLAGPTFNLLPDDATALRALERIRMHLAPGGGVLIPLFIPRPTKPTNFGRARTHTTDDGAEMRFSAVSEVRDDVARTQITMLRYELHTAAASEIVERPWVLHWYTQDGFRAIVEQSGLAVTRVMSDAGTAVVADDPSFNFLLRHTDA